MNEKYRGTYLKDMPGLYHSSICIYTCIFWCIDVKITTGGS